MKKEYNFKGYKIKDVKEEYIKKGSKWVLKNSIEKNITNDNYNNVFNSIQFFKNLGGSEKVYKNYTYAGYIPTKLVSISPDKQTKIIRNYEFSKK